MKHVYPCMRAAVIAATLSLVSACSTLPGVTGMGPDSAAAYRAAISDAAVVSPAKVKRLRPLPAGGTVALVSWVSDSRVPCPAGTPCDITLGNDRWWVTLDGEVQAQCKSWNLKGDALRQRLEQLLGLPQDSPPQYRKTQFVRLNVPKTRVERPCLGVDESTPSQPVCTLDAQPSTSPELRNFVGQQMAGSYVTDNPKGPGYPYTRLGYTYDWAPSARDQRYGASEFLIMPGTTIQATAVVDTDNYCTNP
jgi:hypothetical protein